MPEPEMKVAFVTPHAALGTLTPIPAEVAELGPNPPHQFDDEEPEEVEPIGVALGNPVGPGMPLPPVATLHYTQLLDDIWPEYDEPEERTAARLEALLEEVIDEAQRIHLLAQALFEKTPKYKLTDADRERYQKEFTQFLHRLGEYRETLEDLEPESTDTQSVYVGLVRRRQAAGPVPDAIMHLYFAQQLGILADHAEDMGEGFVGRFIDGLAEVDQTIDDAGDRLDEAQDKAREEFQSVMDEVGGRMKKGVLWAAGIALGTTIMIGGTVVLASAVAGSVRDREG